MRKDGEEQVDINITSEPFKDEIRIPVTEDAPKIVRMKSLGLDGEIKIRFRELDKTQIAAILETNG